MKRISKLNLSTNYDITVNIKDSLDCMLKTLGNSVEYEREERDAETVITTDTENNYCTHHLYYDKNGGYPRSVYADTTIGNFDRYHSEDKIVGNKPVFIFYMLARFFVHFVDYIL